MRVSQRLIAGLLALLAGTAARADAVRAGCDIYLKSQDRPAAVIPCSFSQYRWDVYIDHSDGARHDLTPVGDKPGHYVDEKGRPAYRPSGLGDRGQLYRPADQTLYVYWDTAGLPNANGTPRAEPPGTAVAAGSTPPSAASAPLAPFDQTLSLLGITFRVRSANNSSINRLEIVPNGLETDNRVITREIEGTVTRAEVADLNVDGSPEIYVYVTSAGSGSYGSLVAYAANRRKSLSEIFLPPIAENPTASKGYMGHDEFAVVENTFVQRFPIYRLGDVNARPTGGTRQLQYKLVPGEAGWILKLDRLVDY